MRCDRCEAVDAGDPEFNTTFCVLCAQFGGWIEEVRMWQNAERLWVHRKCAFFLASSTTLSEPGSSLAEWVQSVSVMAHFHHCSICRSSLGCTVKCSRPNCPRRFHVTCGQANGCSFVQREDGHRKVSCWEHLTRDVVAVCHVDRLTKPGVIVMRMNPPDIQRLTSSAQDRGSKKKRKIEETAMHLEAPSNDSWEGCCAGCKKPWYLDPPDVSSIACDKCDLWYHFHCVGISGKVAPEGEYLCPKCK